MLSYAHTSLYYVYHVVAELLAFLDDIHIHRTDGVGVEMVVYIVDVLTLQLEMCIRDRYRRVCFTRAAGGECA